MTSTPFLPADEVATWVDDLGIVRPDTVAVYDRVRAPNNRGKWTYTDTVRQTVDGRVGKMPVVQMTDAGQRVVVRETVVFADPTIVVETDDLIAVTHTDPIAAQSFTVTYQVTGVDRQTYQTTAIIHVKAWSTVG